MISRISFQSQLMQALKAFENVGAESSEDEAGEHHHDGLDGQAAEKEVDGEHSEDELIDENKEENIVKRLTCSSACLRPKKGS